MQASEIYELGCRAYNGERDARREWLGRISRLAAPIAVRYGVLPALFAAKAALESGYGSDQYEVDFYEPQFGVRMKRKAQRHNNLIAMNAFRDNTTFLSSFPPPKWESYQATFRDYGPHYHSDHIELTPSEPWMHFRTVEDCCEAWCANMRYQASKNHKPWGATIEQQLLAIESYTPEGSQAETPGMHYEWQDYVLYIYKDYDLYAYDREAYKMSVKMTTANLDEHIRQAYTYAHAHCHYAPTDRHFPPFEDGAADCVGLILRAAYTMGYNEGAKNINQVIGLCEKMGLKKSTDINDVWRHHGVVCMQDKHLVGTVHVSHVYYSLGGKSLTDISKYDLGSNDRIKSPQPFQNVAVNEWAGKRNFLCCYYIPDEKLPDEPMFTAECETLGIVVKEAGIYAGPGTAWRKLGTAKVGNTIVLRGIVLNPSGNLWRAVRYGNTEGYIFATAVTQKNFAEHDAFVRGTDGTLSVRVGAGGGCRKIADLKEGSKVRVIGKAKAADGKVWYNVKTKKLYGFVSGDYLADK